MVRMSRETVVILVRTWSWLALGGCVASSQEAAVLLPLPGPPRGGGFVAHHHDPRMSEPYARRRDSRLSEMRARAEQLREALYNATVRDDRETTLGVRLHEFLRRKLVDDGKDWEISVCRPQGVAFIHVYKAAGTTAKYFMEAACPEPRHHFACCGCEDEPNPVFCHEKDEAEQWSENVTTSFAIVRDPVERFLSGIFELALRDDPWINARIDRARRENITVAEAAIDDLLERGPFFLPDAHLMEQTFFLSDSHHLPTALTYLAKVGPDLVDDLGALGHRLFGLPRTALENLARHRDAHDATYGGDKMYIHDEPLNAVTLAKIKQYYEFDYVWIDPPRRVRHRPRL